MSSGRVLLVSALLLTVCLPTALAQVTGDIEGTITDPSGTRLPGVRVEATSPRLPGIRVATTSDDGRYRIPAVPPGLYRITAALAGFETVQHVITVSLDATATLDVQLRLSVREVLTVDGGEVPLVDVTSTTTGTRYTDNIMSKLAIGRNYADVLRSNPGVSDDFFVSTQGRAAALTIYGATSLENQWIIDGVNTTNVIRGLQSKAINNEFIEEIEVKTGGYQAEYGRALGGIINVITKSGGNQYRGDAFLYYDGLEDPQLNSANQVDYGADLGGFLLRDKLWFFAAYDRVEAKSNVSTYLPRLGIEMKLPRKQRDDLYSGKLTWNLDSRSSMAATAFSDPTVVTGALLPNRVATSERDTWDVRREIGGLDFSLRATHILGRSAVVSWQGAQHRDRFELFGDTGGPRVSDFTCTGGTLEEPCSPPTREKAITGGVGFIGPGNRNHARREQYRVDGTYYARAHELKLGADYQTARSAVVRAYSGGQIVERRNEYGQIYYAHSFFAPSPDELTPVADINEGRSSDFAVYIQDSWKIGSRWTLNAGLRWGDQRLANHTGVEVLNTTAEWQPRLGVVWDPTGTGSSKIFASVGRFYYSMPTALSITRYGGSTDVTTFNFDPTNVAQDPAVFGHERARISGGGYGGPVESGLRGTYQDEFIVGVEKLFSPRFSVAINGRYRRLGRIIEERCDLDLTSNGASCAIINPGSSGRYARGDFVGCNGLDGQFYECAQGALPIGPARRVYRGIEILARRSVAERLWLQASYAYSSLRGNYDGFVAENPFGGQTPGINVDFDYPQLTRNAYGRLFLDRPHSARVDGSYTTPFHLFVGLGAFAQSGAPVDRYTYFNEIYETTLFLVPRGSVKRLPTLWQADLTLGYPISVGPLRATLQIYVFNIFNTHIETWEATGYRNSPGPNYPADMFDPNILSDDPRYGSVLDRQRSRRIRGALKFSF
jgi:carboxypeptidase family protein/TonB-dependent receptor-like protein